MFHSCRRQFTGNFKNYSFRYPRYSPSSPTSRLAAFATGLSLETIHILVEVPALGECGTRISCSMTEATMLLTENKAPLPSLPNLLKERQQFNAKLPAMAPSTLGDPAKISKIQATDTQKFVWSRPPDADATIPVTLCHPVFRQFVDDCQTHQLIDKDNKLVRELTATMSEFFPDEDARAAELRGHYLCLTPACNTPTTSAVDYPVTRRFYHRWCSWHL